MMVEVFLSANRVRDMAGRWHSFPQERLVRQGIEDRVLAVIQAPRGSRIRRRPDQHGADQLLVPVNPLSFWDRWFGRKAIIPVKYLIHEARLGAHHLILVQYHPQVRGEPTGPPPLSTAG